MTTHERCDCHACTWARLNQIERTKFEALVVRDAQVKAAQQFPNETPLDSIKNLSVRSRNALQCDELRTVGDVRAKTIRELLLIPNFGPKCLNELREMGLI
jgi:DNA-directed RNA polymerase alpha subunit